MMESNNIIATTKEQLKKLILKGNSYSADKAKEYLEDLRVMEQCDIRITDEFRLSDCGEAKTFIHNLRTENLAYVLIYDQTFCKVGMAVGRNDEISWHIWLYPITSL